MKKKKKNQGEQSCYIHSICLSLCSSDVSLCSHLWLLVTWGWQRRRQKASPPSRFVSGIFSHKPNELLLYNKPKWVNSDIQWQKETFPANCCLVLAVQSCSAHPQLVQSSASLFPSTAASLCGGHWCCLQFVSEVLNHPSHTASPAHGEDSAGYLFLFVEVSLFTFPRGFHSPFRAFLHPGDPLPYFLSYILSDQGFFR